ncbi:MAG: DNA primase [Patescibacteria group bacterium]
MSQTEDIKHRLDIVDVVQSYIKLEKAGINYRARCPFHQEKSPSFFVSPTRQTWRCFGCQKGGDHFSFVEEIEHVDFPEALKILADRAGIQLKREDPKLVSERVRFYAIMEEGAKFFEANLHRENPNRATPMMQYLLDRGLREETMKKFRIGFAPDSWDALLSHLVKMGYREADIEKVGLIIKKEGSHQGRSHYDRFRSRIIFPIADSNGKIIAFGGRVYDLDGTKSDAEQGAKYINSPETPIYYKSRVLYAFDKAKSAIREKGECVLVEGYMDAVMCHQAGVTNAVAVSGTALTPDQLRLIQRLCGSLIFSFDMDSAGQNATKRSLELAAEFDLQRKVLLLPSGKDPADAVKENMQILIDALASARPLMDYYFEEIGKKFDVKDPIAKKSAGAFFLPHIRGLKNEIERSHWIQKFSELVGVPERAVRDELQKIPRDRMLAPDAAPKNPKEAERTKSRRDLIERELLALYLQDSAYIEKEIVSRGEGAVPFSGLLTRRFYEEIVKNPKLFSNEGKHDTTLASDMNLLYDELQFQKEFIAENEIHFEDAVTMCLRELFQDHYREKMQELHLQIKDLEKRGNKDRINQLLREFHTLATKMKN